jgi:hypothetical protein
LVLLARKAQPAMQARLVQPVPKVHKGHLALLVRKVRKA